MNNQIELGWTSFPLIKKDDYDKDYAWDFYFDYGKLFEQETHLLHRFGRYKLKTIDYLLEIENVIRLGLLTFDKLIIEFPYYEENSEIFAQDWISYDYFFEKDVDCEWYFFSLDALKRIKRKLGNSIENREITLLPSFHVSWEDPEEGDEWGGFKYGSDPQLVSVFVKPQSRVWEKLFQCQKIETNDSLVENAQKFISLTKIPILSGGDIKDIISLRRDETEAFKRWKDYVDEISLSQNINEKMVADAINEGLRELSDRFKQLNSKGLFDVIGTTLTFTSAIIAFSLEGQIATVSGSLGGLAALTNSLKSLFEYKKERQNIKKNKLYFAWLVRNII